MEIIACDIFYITINVSNVFFDDLDDHIDENKMEFNIDFYKFPKLWDYKNIYWKYFMINDIPLFIAI
mgnify:CR=1 FL=1